MNFLKKSREKIKIYPILRTNCLIFSVKQIFNLLKINNKNHILIQILFYLKIKNKKINKKLI